MGMVEMIRGFLKRLNKDHVGGAECLFYSAVLYSVCTAACDAGKVHAADAGDRDYRIDTDGAGGIQQLYPGDRQ